MLFKVHIYMQKICGLFSFRSHKRWSTAHPDLCTDSKFLYEYLAVYMMVFKALLKSPSLSPHLLHCR